MNVRWHVFQGDKSVFLYLFLKIFSPVTPTTHTQSRCSSPYQLGQNFWVFLKAFQVIVVASRAENYSRASCVCQPPILVASVGSLHHPEYPTLCRRKKRERWGKSLWHFMSLSDLQSGLGCKTGGCIKKK